MQRGVALIGALVLGPSGRCRTKVRFAGDADHFGSKGIETGPCKGISAA